MARDSAPVFTPEMFEFSGQASLDAFTVRDKLKEHGWRRYEYALAHGPQLIFQRIRDLVTEFPTCQRRSVMGRPAIDERDILKCLLLRQVLDTPFRQTEGHARLNADLLKLTHVPDAATLSLKNRSPRFVHLLYRFHHWMLAQLPKRKAIVATDATGFGPDKRCWRETPFRYRMADRRWVKMNFAVEIPSLLILNHVPMRHNQFESAAFEETWDGLPDNITPIRSLADAAYAGNACLEVVRRHGAIPMHDFPRNAKHVAQPATERDRLINFGRHWPKRYQNLKKRRALIESLFSAMKNNFSDRTRCRSKLGRTNEGQAKSTAMNIWTLVNRAIMSAS